MNGPFRKKSEQYGLIVYLSADAHRKLHVTPAIEKGLKRIAQQKFEETYPRELWMKEFKKNYEI